MVKGKGGVTGNTLGCLPPEVFVLLYIYLLNDDFFYRLYQEEWNIENSIPCLLNVYFLLIFISISQVYISRVLQS